MSRLSKMPPSEDSTPPSAGSRSPLDHTADFCRRHVGPGEADIAEMLESLGLDSLDALVGETVPGAIRRRQDLDLPAPLAEHEALPSSGRRRRRTRFTAPSSGWATTTA